MVVSKGIVKVSSIIVNLICTLIVPCVESLAYKLSIGGVCECPSPLSSPATERGRKRKKLKNNSGSSGSTEQSNHHHHHHNDVKRIKLLLDITVGQNGSEVLDIKASTKGNSREKYRSKEGQCKGKPGFVLRLLNLPSTILLYFVQRVRQLAHDLEALEEQPSCDNSRIKKSPKRRITRGNYRKIIPFFPFNLLGFSNYSAFQMPSITRSSSSTTTGGTTDEKNNLNVSSVSANGKSRSKRPRHTSTEDDSDSFSDLSDEDIAYLELPESLSSSMLTGNANISASAGGHDEVDSDETAETIRKKGNASSSEKNPLLPHHRLSSGRAGRRSSGSRRVQVHLNTSTSEDNCGNLTSYTDLDSSNNGGVLGEDHRVEFTFIKELNEAANESYNSIDDPDYVPAEESCTSTSDTSYATDKGCSDESLLAENGIKNGEADKEEKSNEVIAAVVEQNFEKEAEEPGNVTLTNGTTSPVNGETQITSTTPSAAATTTTSNAPQSKVAPNSGGGGSKKKNKNKKQNGNGTPKNGNRSNVSTTGNEDDYKTPEEGEHEGVRHF